MGSRDSYGLVALVPMRHVSERVPGKNYRLLDGQPLYAYILHSLLECEHVARVIVDTDSPRIEAGLSDFDSRVSLLSRPEALRGGDVPMNEIIAHDLSQIDGRFFLQTHSTNPLLRAETIDKAIVTFMESFPTFDSLFSVTRFQARLWDGAAKPLNHDPEILLRTQDLEPLFVENSCLYLFEREIFLARANRIGLQPQLYEIDPMEALDIDEEADFAYAEFLVQKRAAALHSADEE